MTRKQRLESEQVTTPGQRLFYTGAAATKKLALYERIVRVDDSAAIATIMLPPVSECKGLTFDITAASGGYDVTIVPTGGATYPDCEAWPPGGATAQVLTANEDRVLLQSNGSAWQSLVDLTT
jgi:hypothetical protein